MGLHHLHQWASHVPNAQIYARDRNLLRDKRMFSAWTSGGHVRIVLYSRSFHIRMTADQDDMLRWMTTMKDLLHAFPPSSTSGPISSTWVSSIYESEDLSGISLLFEFSNGTTSSMTRLLLRFDKWTLRTLSIRNIRKGFFRWHYNTAAWYTAIFTRLEGV